MITRRLALTALAAALAVPAVAHDYKLGMLEISHPWTRVTPATAQSGGGFLTITNKGTTADRLIAARSTVSGKVEVHEMKMDGNVMRMRELEKGLEIPAGATVMLKPGGYHIMFMG
jgi:copper(I)-binding protein